MPEEKQFRMVQEGVRYPKANRRNWHGDLHTYVFSLRFALVLTAALVGAIFIARKEAV